MAEENTKLRRWVETEIPTWLNKFKSYEEFAAAMPSACASYEWKIVAWAMAKERWGLLMGHYPDWR